MLPGKHVLILLVALGTVSCSHSHDVSRSEVSSYFHSGISLSAEVELFIGQMLTNRATAAFAKGHVVYLRTQAMHLSKELQKTHPEESMAPQLETCQIQMAALISLLTQLEGQITDGRELSGARQQAASIKSILEQTEATL